MAWMVWSSAKMKRMLGDFPYAVPASEKARSDRKRSRVDRFRIIRVEMITGFSGNGKGFLRLSQILLFNLCRMDLFLMDLILPSREFIGI